MGKYWGQGARRSAFARLRLAVAAVMGVALMLAMTQHGQAANPPSGTVSVGTQVAWNYDPVVQEPPAVPTQPPWQDQCPNPVNGAPKTCDNFDLTVQLPATFDKTTQVATLTVNNTWDGGSIPTDMDYFLIGPDGPNSTEYGPGSPDLSFPGPGQEKFTLTNPLPGVYHLRQLNFNNPMPVAGHGVANLVVGPIPNPGPPPAIPPVRPGDPSFTNYVKTNPLGGTDGAGEVALGADWSTPDKPTSPTVPNTVMWQDSVPQTERVTFADPGNPTTPATATWTDVTSLSQAITFDPIGFMDHPYPGEVGYPGTGNKFDPTGANHRWFSSQLLTSAGFGQGGAGCSDLAYSDDDGGRGLPGVDWQPSSGCGFPGGDDHQTVGGGPYSPNGVITTNPAYPHAIYYCAQQSDPGSTAFCARSDDGGVHFGPAITTYSAVGGLNPIAPGECVGLHGHVRVAPDGTVYLPNKACYDTPAAGTTPTLRPAVVASTDNGQTWSVKTVPDAISVDVARATSDPSVAAGSKNSVYFGFTALAGNDVHAEIAVSHDHGSHWTPSVDVGAPFGIKNVQFPEVIAGDDNRAAMSFLGTTVGGNDQTNTFPGVWHLYVAFTYNGGQSWTTVDATPNDPVQRGCIWNSGGSNNCRNLLDFDDITLDRSGRVMVGYSDGCTGSCVTAAGANGQGPFSSVGTIARQNCSTQGVLSKGLFAAYDSTGFIGCGVSSNPTASHVAYFTAYRAKGMVSFHWRLGIARGVSHFDVFAGQHRLNAQPIRLHASRDYSYRTHNRVSGRFLLRVTLTGGKQVMVPAS